MRPESLITAADKGLFFFTQPPASGEEGFRDEMLVLLLVLSQARALLSFLWDGSYEAPR